MPCTGCFGPLDDVMDQGAKAVSFLSSIIDSDDEEELEGILKGIPDPAGIFYRYTLPRISLTRKKEVGPGA
jgi:F420-non-reducing hydrogenase small subunit